MFPSPLDMLDDIVVNEFSEKAALDFRNKVMKIAKLDPQRPIVIYIDSYGGSVYSLGSMIATMNEAPNPFITVAVGKSMSCGAMLLSAGDIRFADQDSEMLIHEISAGAIGDVNDVKNDSEHIVTLNKKWMNWLGKNCGKENGYEYIKKLIKDQDGRNIYLNAQQAKEFGLVDYVGTPFIQPVTLYQITNSNKDDPVEEKKPAESSDGPPPALAELLNALQSGNANVQMVKLSDIASEKSEKNEVKKAKKKTDKKKKVTKKTKKIKKKIDKKNQTDSTDNSLGGNNER